MNNLKKFATEADYSAATLNYPAVSWVVSGDVVYFDKSAPTPSFSGLTVYYNITDLSQETNLFKYAGGSGSGSGSGSGGDLPSAMVIDGAEVYPTPTYQFDTVGEHIVNYSFADNMIPDSFLYDTEGTYNNVVKVLIGDAITSITNFNFGYCSGLTSVTIGSGVTTIGMNAFDSCAGLTSIVSNATTAPTIQSDTFIQIKTGGTLTVPSGSSGYDNWMQNANYYLGLYNWTKVEQ